MRGAITLEVNIEDDFRDGGVTTVRVTELGMTLDEVYEALKRRMRETGTLAAEAGPAKMTVAGRTMTVDEYNAETRKLAQP